MARSMWAGSISFGLVNIPVRVFTAVRQKEIRFHMLHDEDGGRIHLKRVCAKDGEEVPYDEIAKGYELSRGRYVKFSKEELEAIAPEASRAINIEDFVDIADIDPIFYEHTYYLAPDKGAGRPYKLLLEAMRKTKKVGIARMVMRTKQYLCAIRPLEDALAMSTMSFADEIVSLDELDELPGKSAHPQDRELKMAEQLVDSLTTKWKPEKYKDTHREQVEELIQRKASGEDIVADMVEPERPAKVVSLMDALQRSLQAGKDAADRGTPHVEARTQDKGERRHHAKAARTSRTTHAGKKSRPRATAARTARKKAPAKKKKAAGRKK